MSVFLKSCAQTSTSTHTTHTYIHWRNLYNSSPWRSIARCYAPILTTLTGNHGSSSTLAPYSLLLPPPTNTAIIYINALNEARTEPATHTLITRLPEQGQENEKFPVRLISQTTATCTGEQRACKDRYVGVWYRARQCNR